MSIQLSSGTLNLAGKNKLSQLVSHPDGLRDTRHRFVFALQLKNTNAAPYMLTAADMLALWQACVHDTWNYQWGEVAKDKADQGLVFNDLRQQFIGMTYRDFTIATADAPTASIGTLGPYNAGCSYAVVVPGSGTNGGVMTVILELTRSFLIERPNSKNITRWCPGATQVKQMYWEFNCALNGFSANAAQVTCIGGTYRQEADVIDGPDVWVNVVRMFKNPTVGLENPGPGEGGKLIYCVEQTAPAASTSLVNTFSLRRTGDTDLHTDQLPQDILREQATQLDPLGSLVDLNSLVTCLWRAGPEATLDTLPSNELFKLKFTKQDLATFQIAWLYAPATGDDTVALIGRNATEGKQNPKGAQVLLTGASRARGASAATDGIRLMTPDEPGFASSPGFLARPNTPPELSVPVPIVAASHNAIKAVAGHPVGDDISASQALTVAGRIPAASHPTRGKVTAHMARIHTTVHPSGTKAASPAALANVAAAST